MDFRNDILNKIMSIQGGLPTDTSLTPLDPDISIKNQEVVDMLDTYILIVVKLQEPFILLSQHNEELLPNNEELLPIDNRFLNAAYFQAKMIRDGLTLSDSEPTSLINKTLGVKSKREVMDEIMDYIKSLASESK